MPRYMYNMYPRPFYRPRVLWNASEKHTYNTSPGMHDHFLRSVLKSKNSSKDVTNQPQGMGSMSLKPKHGRNMSEYILVLTQRLKKERIIPLTKLTLSRDGASYASPRRTWIPMMYRRQSAQRMLTQASVISLLVSIESIRKSENYAGNHA